MKKIMFLLLVLAVTPLSASDSTVITGAWDTYCYNESPTIQDYNYGVTTTFKVGDIYGLSNFHYVAWLQFDMSGYTAGASAHDSTIMWLWFTGQNTAGDWQSDSDSIYAVHALKVYFREGAENGACPQTDTGATWENRGCFDLSGPCNCQPLDEEWNTGGSWGADTDYDTSNVHPDSVTFSWKGSGGYHYINVTHLVQYQLENTNYGFRVSEEVPAQSGQYAYMTGIATDMGSGQPKLVIYYTEAEAGEETGWGRGGKNQQGEYLNDR